jgi:N-acetylglucosamine kinase-like BadF-type ATPase
MHIFEIQSKNQLKYIIGIDSGATKSEAVIVPAVNGVSPETSGWKSFTSAPINYNLLGFDGTKKRLVEIIKKASAKMKPGSLAAIAAGISGARHATDRLRLEKEISKTLKFSSVKIYSDTEIAFASVFEPKEKNCGILIAGTGSIFYYRDAKGKLKRVGGWGRHIGDEGSGHWIAREALVRVTKHFDLIGGYTSVLKAIRYEFGITAENLVEHVYHKGFEISRITPHVFRSAEKGDKIAKDIIQQAAASLAGHLAPLGKLNARVALVGSLFSQEKLLEKYLKKIADTKYPRIEFVKPKNAPVWGAVRLAISSLRTK